MQPWGPRSAHVLRVSGRRPTALLAPLDMDLCRDRRVTYHMRSVVQFNAASMSEPSPVLCIGRGHKGERATDTALSEPGVPLQENPRVIPGRLRWKKWARRIQGESSGLSVWGWGVSEAFLQRLFFSCA